MADQRVYPAQGIDVQHLGQSLSDWYAMQGYKSQSLPGPSGGVMVQATKGSGWITTATNQALTVNLIPQGDNVIVQTGGARWADKAVSGVVGLIVFWPLVALPAYGAYKQQQLITDTYSFIDQYVASGGQVPVGMPMASGAMAPSMAAPQASVPCPSCKKPVRAGAKFCDNCGAKVSADCAKCGAALRPGAKFCDNCGAAV